MLILHGHYRQAAPYTLIMALLLLVPMAAGANALERLFAPKSELWAFWDTRTPDSTKQVDHSAWNAFLERYVLPGEDGINRVRYAAVSSNDRQQLTQYINRLQRVPIRRYNPDQQLAYWINLYNALTVSVVLQHYPVSSIRDIDISPGFFADGPWGKKLLTIEEQAVSLNDIEHRILRPIWQDPRLHYALNCASLGCPNLPNRAFLSDNTEALLEQGATAYINHPRAVMFQNGNLHVSSIYSWFRDDFGGSDSAVIEHLQHYAAPALADRLSAASGIAGDDYNWSLNDAP
jgi:hypothetical protein